MAGHSMEPTLRDGDWLLVDPRAFADSPPRAGQLVVGTDPRADGRLIIKRIKSISPDGSLVVGGEHVAHAEEGVGVAASRIVGRPWFRYWPLRRVGRVH